MTPESAVQKAITDLLAAKRIPYWRMNTGAISATHRGKKRFFKFGAPGMADLLAAITFPEIIPGFRLKHSAFLWIEVKAPKKKQTAEQKEFEKYVTDNGMNYLCADSVDVVIEWLKQHK